jgi:putative tryptophan/tyrosine transport system substrate-binding protein
MLIHIRRREFIVTLGGVACAWPLAARAQQPAMPVIGWLGTDSREVENSEVVSFQQGLKEAGYIEGQNLAIEYRWAEGQYDRLPALAADLVRRQVTVIAASANGAALAAKAATTTVPIVFQVGFDPVQLGLVASLNRPGGNATGVTSLNTEVGPKKLELLHELVPNVAVIGLLVNPDNPTAEIQSREAQVAARKLGLELHIVHARTERDFDAAFATLVKLRAGALVIGPDPIFRNRSRQLGALALRYAVPAISPYRDFAAGGGLMSYGTNIADLFRPVGIYAGRILKGEKPADLPVQQAVKVDLVLNFKTAKTLGITVPLPLSGRADEVIE